MLDARSILFQQIQIQHSTDSRKQAGNVHDLDRRGTPGHTNMRATLNEK